MLHVSLSVVRKFQRNCEMVLSVNMVPNVLSLLVSLDSQCGSKGTYCIEMPWYLIIPNLLKGTYDILIQ